MESVEFLCRHLRGGECFGGIQVILCGDFYQLPPIKDDKYGDDGSYCLKSNFFEGMFPHVVHLQTVHRQSEALLIKSVGELEIGLPSQETNAFLASLIRPLEVQDQTEIIKLFAKNEQVDLYNYQAIMNADGELHTFQSEDNGDKYYFKKLLAPKLLGS